MRRNLIVVKCYIMLIIKNWDIWTVKEISTRILPKNLQSILQHQQSLTQNFFWGPSSDTSLVTPMSILNNRHRAKTFNLLKKSRRDFQSIRQQTSILTKAQTTSATYWPNIQLKYFPKTGLGLLYHNMLLNITYNFWHELAYS